VGLDAPLAALLLGDALGLGEGVLEGRQVLGVAGGELVALTLEPGEALDGALRRRRGLAARRGGFGLRGLGPGAPSVVAKDAVGQTFSVS
jgi:hypothetical protein